MAKLYENNCTRFPHIRQVGIVRSSQNENSRSVFVLNTIALKMVAFAEHGGRRNTKAWEVASRQKGIYLDLNILHAHRLHALHVLHG